MRCPWPLAALVLAPVVAGCSNGAEGPGLPAPTTTVRLLVEVNAPEDASPPCRPGTAPGHVVVTVLANDAAGVGGTVAPAHAALRAFAAYCNHLGGIDGRALEVRLVEVGSDANAAVAAACDDGTLALVGATATLDRRAAQVAVDCGLPDVPADAVDAERGDSTNVIAPVPNPLGTFGIGPGRVLQREHPEAALNAAALFDADHELDARRRIEAFEELGYTFVYTAVLESGAADAPVHAAALRDRGARALVVDASPGEVVRLMRQVHAEGIELEFILAGPDAEDALVAAGGEDVEGLFVESVNAPLDEPDVTEEAARYSAWLEATQAHATPSARGARAWSAALLFAEAAQSVDGDLTRQSLMDALILVESWDGRGLHAPSAPGANRPSDCWLLLRADGDGFARDRPRSGFTCEADNRFPLVGDYGVGAAPRA